MSPDGSKMFPQYPKSLCNHPSIAPGLSKKQLDRAQSSLRSDHANKFQAKTHICEEALREIRVRKTIKDIFEARTSSQIVPN